MDLSFLQSINSIDALMRHTPNERNTYTRSAPSLFASLLKEQLQSPQTNEKSASKANLFLDPRVFHKWQLHKQTAANVSKRAKVNDVQFSRPTSVTKSPLAFDTFVQQAAKKYNLDPKLIHSVIKHESNYNPNAKSHAGAVGLMQLMPQTARMLQVNNMYDPQQNIDGGAKYLRQMIDRYDGNIKLALAAYNAGPGNVDRYGGIPPFKETQNYVPRVYNYYMNA